MSLLSLPNEILLLIANLLDQQSLSSFFQTTSFFSQLLMPILTSFAIQDKDRAPALCWAAKNNHEGLVRLLLAQGFNPNQTDGTWYEASPIHYAANKGNEAIARILLDNGAKADTTKPATKERLQAESCPDTALHIATLRNNESMVGLLLAHGADVEARNSQGKTPLHISAEHGYVGVARLLWGSGCSINSRAKMSTPLHIAVEHDDESFVKMLLKWDADTEASDRYGLKPLNCAVRRRQYTISKLLLEAGADVNAQGRLGMSAVHDAVQIGSITTFREIFGLLVEYGADVNIQDKRGCAPLHLAVLYGLEESIEALLASGADPELKVKGWAMTALDVAKRKKRKGVFKLFGYSAEDCETGNL